MFDLIYLFSSLDIDQTRRRGTEMPQPTMMELITRRTARDDPQTIGMTVRMKVATSEEDSTMTTATRISVILSGSERATRNKILRWKRNECWRAPHLELPRRDGPGQRLQPPRAADRKHLKLKAVYLSCLFDNNLQELSL